MKVDLRARTDERRPRCVYCREDVQPAELDECPGCRTTLHLACRAELGRCPTAGCAGAGRAPHGAEVRGQPGVGQRPAVVQGVHRPRSKGELGLVLACGALVGLFVGWIVAAMASRHGIESKEMWRFMPPAALIGALETAAICALGVRREPWVRLHYKFDGEGRHDAVPVVLGLMVALAVLGGYVAADLLHTARGFVTGVVASPLLALPLLLRGLGWGEGQRP